MLHYLLVCFTGYHKKYKAEYTGMLPETLTLLYLEQVILHITMRIIQNWYKY